MADFRIKLTGLDRLATVDLKTSDDHSKATLAAFSKAKTLLEQDDLTGAANQCLHMLQTNDVDVQLLTHAILLLRKAGRGDLALTFQDMLLTQLRRLAPQDPENPLLYLNIATVFSMLDLDAEAHDFAVIAARYAPLDIDTAYVLAALKLALGDPEGAVAAWDELFADQPDNGLIRLKLAQLLAAQGFMEPARQMLDLAEPLCASDLPEFQYLADGIRGTDHAQNQVAMAASIFDAMSESYDKTLASLDNQGPKIVARVLEQLQLPKTGKLHILDAGCGTGLCAPLLLPMAEVLHGCDLSIGMLNESKRKGRYTLLTRSDLASIGTLPAGPFDLIVTSDVLVYFGDLSEVFGNFAKITRPGGWLIVTVEDAGDPGPARGWALDVSGRTKHSLSYLKTALAKAGYSAPKHAVFQHLRQELGMPVPGIGFAAQRLSLLR